MKDTNKDQLWVNVGSRLRDLREEKQETQAELGVAIGETRSLVNMWESGERAIKAEALLALAGHYGCTVDYLLCRPHAARSPAPDMQAACAVSHLSQKAIENVAAIVSEAEAEDMVPSSIAVINLLESDSCRAFFAAYQNVVEAVDVLNHLCGAGPITTDRLIKDLRVAVYEFSETASATVKQACNVNDAITFADEAAKNYRSDLD